MGPEEKEHLIEGNGVVATPRSPDDLDIKVKPKRTVIVEPVFLMYTLSVMGASPVFTQYLYARFERDYPILVNKTHHGGNVTTDGSTSVVCAQSNHSDPVYIAIQSVQADTARWNMYLQLCSSILAVLTTLIYGSYSDARGRRPVLIMPCAAMTIKLVLNTLVIAFDLPLYCLFIGPVFDGLSGSYTTVMMAVFSYTADTTTKKERGFRIAVLEGCLFLGMSLAPLGIGYFIKATGFLYPYAACAGVMVVNVVYIVFFVPETILDKKKHFSMKQSLQNFIQVYSFKQNRRHVKLCLLCLMVFMFFLSFGGSSIQTLFVMDVPLCWGPDKIGIYTTVRGVASQVIGIIVLKLLQKFTKIPELGIATIGVVSSVGGQLVTAWATTDLMIYMARLVGVLAVLSMPMFRSRISCLVRTEEQGAAFAGVACVEEVCTLTDSFTMGLIYQKTLFFMPGFIFLVSAGFGSVAIILIIIYQITVGKKPVSGSDKVASITRQQVPDTIN